MRADVAATASPPLHSPLSLLHSIPPGWRLRLSLPHPLPHHFTSCRRHTVVELEGGGASDWHGSRGKSKTNRRFNCRLVDDFVFYILFLDSHRLAVRTCGRSARTLPCAAARLSRLLHTQTARHFWCSEPCGSV